MNLVNFHHCPTCIQPEALAAIGRADPMGWGAPSSQCKQVCYERTAVTLNAYITRVAGDLA